MNISRRAVLGGAMTVGLASAAPAQWADPTPAEGDPAMPLWPARETLRLWPGAAPGQPAKLPVPNLTMNGPLARRQLWVRGVSVPEILVYRPARPDGSALLSIPGGGYGFLSVQNEGMDLAQRLNAIGTTVFVLVYRLPGEGWADRSIVPLQDAQRAMRVIRARAAEFRIEPDRLGVVGFSAGGHLAADLAVSHTDRCYAPVDGADTQSARPSFLSLVYAVTSLRPGSTQGGSVTALLGKDPSSASVDARSPVLRVKGDTPASFLVHANDDPLVPLENSLDWLAACRKAGVKCEAHLFEQGGHGFGLHLDEKLPGARWPDLFAAWMRTQGG